MGCATQDQPSITSVRESEEPYLSGEQQVIKKNSETIATHDSKGNLTGSRATRGKDKVPTVAPKRLVQYPIPGLDDVASQNVFQYEVQHQKVSVAQEKKDFKQLQNKMITLENAAYEIQEKLAIKGAEIMRNHKPNFLGNPSPSNSGQATHKKQSVRINVECSFCHTQYPCPLYSDTRNFLDSLSLDEEGTNLDRVLYQEDEKIISDMYPTDSWVWLTTDERGNKY